MAKVTDRILPIRAGCHTESGVLDAQCRLMGSSLTWLAVEGADAATVAAALGLQPTGRRVESTRLVIAGRAMPSGWFVVVADADGRLVAKATLERLSTSATVLSGFLEEHVMASRCSLWKRGKRAWQVDHQGEESSLHLKTSGRLPEAYAAIRDSALKLQQAEGGEEAGVDHVFDVPMALSRELIGFRPDEDSLQEFEVLGEPPLRRFWRRTRRWRTLLVVLGIVLGVGALVGGVTTLIARLLRLLIGLFH